MAMLHIIRRSGFTSNALAQCLSMVLADDSILLMDDGCYNVNHPLLLEALTSKPNTAVYFVDVHTSARAQAPIQVQKQVPKAQQDNISANNPESGFISIPLSGALTQIFQHDNSITWS